MGNIDALERHDGYAPLRNMLRGMAEKTDEWAGIPLPIDDAKLVIEKKYPHAQALMLLGGTTQTAAEVPEDQRISAHYKKRSHFYSTHHRCLIVVLEHKETGAITWAFAPMVHHFRQDLMTMACSVAWGIEQESQALQLLATLLKHHAFKKYLLTGMFLESSERSGLTYMFRRLKPTVVITPRGEDGNSQILCALCMHPIGYYEDSWAGAMCPTDDVIAHLQLMRADEPRFWKRSNQIRAYRPEAGL